MNGQAIIEAIREHYTVPPHIKAAASALNYDLLHGPAFANIPDDITTFTVDDYATFAEDLPKPEAAVSIIPGPLDDLVDHWINNNVEELYYDSMSGYVQTNEPEGYEDEDGTWVEPEWEDYYKVSPKEVVKALFGVNVADHYY